MSQGFVRLGKLEDIRVTALKLEQTAVSFALAAREASRPDPAPVRASIEQLRGRLRADAVAAAAPAEITASSDSLAQEALSLVDTIAARLPESRQKAARASLEAQQAQVERAVSAATTGEQTHIQQQKTQANTAATQSIEALIGLIVAGAVIAMSLGLLFSLGLIRTIRRVKEAATRMANGDFSQTVRANSQDELGKLSQAFNQMSDRLRDSYRRLAVEKQRDEALLESMSEGLVAIDEQGQIVMINEVAVNLLELPPGDQLIGAPLLKSYTLYDKDDRPLGEAKQPALIALRTGLPATEVLTFRPKVGKKLLLSVNANPVRLDQQTIGAIVVMRDVTKEKEVDRMKTEFISLASHQLRTPLSAIKWFTEMLLAGDAGKLTGEQTEFTQNVYDSTQRMIELVNSLLNISRIESGRIIIEPKSTDLSELVGGIINDLRAKIEERHQNLIISVHKDLPKVKLDPRLIGQVYMNLLTNAIKYTPKGGEISVFISKKDDCVLSQVTDNGYGIAKSQQNRVFQKFFRAENIIKVETDGTGLGLYLIKSIIDTSGGKIWFKSKEGQGTTFWFTLPLSGMKAKEGEVTLDV